MTTGFSFPAVSAPDYAITRVSRLNLKQQPQAKSQTIRMLSKGSHLRIVNRHDSRGWVQVVLPDGSEGWTQEKYLRHYQPQPNLDKQHSTGSEYTSYLEQAVFGFIEKNKLNGGGGKDQLQLMVQDLETGQMLVSVKAQEQVKAASLIKVPVLHAYMLEWYRGHITHTDSLYRHLRSMINLSSNYSTNHILKTLGGPEHVSELLRNTGLYNHLKLVEYIPAGGRTYQNKISASDLNRLFARIWKKRILGSGFSQEDNQQASEFMLSLLGIEGHRHSRDRLKDGTCFEQFDSVKIWDKTGFVRGLNGNSGIIEIDTPQGRKAYSVVSIIDREDYWRIRGGGNRWAAVQSYRMRRISEMIYAWFMNQHQGFEACGRNELVKYATHTIDLKTRSQFSYMDPAKMEKSAF
ncbi:MAG: serine hydrolase [SAR324 cluster bacterium]|nr:serine hydrolase [SAR324 cluster bacterium]